MSKKLLAAIITVALLLIAFLFICPAVYKDLTFLPQEAKDAINSDTVPPVSIEWQ